MKHLIEIDGIEAAILHTALLYMTMPNDVEEKQRKVVLQHVKMSTLILTTEEHRFGYLCDMLAKISDMAKEELLKEKGG